jgi:hypothetical protein
MTAVSFITNNLAVSKINEYANSYSPFLDNTFIYYLDGGCPLCSLDLMEIENIRNSLFQEKNITPIVILYGDINDYTMNLISEKKIFKYPIYNISNESYNKFIRDFNIKKNPLLVKQDGDIIYSGDPLSRKDEMRNLITTIKTI